MIVCPVSAQLPNMLDGHPITHIMNDYERSRQHEIGQFFKGTVAPEAPVLNIAEFQPAQGVLIRYPFGLPVASIAQLSQIVTVTTLVASNGERNTVNRLYQNNGVNMNNVDFLITNTDSYWTRDYGPVFIIDGNDQFGVVDFIYNRPRHNDDAVIQAVANHFNINYYAMDMVHTGGNYMCDGYGTAASTTLTVTENPSETVTSLQTMAQEYLGIEHYYFIQDPMQQYIEHIDCWGKFLGVDKILIVQVPTTDSRYQNYENVADMFASTTTPWGNPYRVYRVYTPTGLYDVAPYTNSLILNDHVFVPVAGNASDDAAIAVYQTAMPGYTIVPVTDAYNTSWENTDALHCRTHEIADLGMLLIRHYPILGNYPHQDSIPVVADITAYSGAALLDDSISLYYRIDENSWQHRPMLHNGGKTWQGYIPIPHNGGIIDYYIQAQDGSGRIERHPYIGAADPHRFHVATTGMASLNCHPLVVFPNPANAAFSIRSENLQTITIYNRLGQLIQNIIPETIPTIVNCSSWSNGIYILRCTTKTGKIITRKVSVMHN